ncbi:unnamed protein product [Calypogeia fissa]
MDPSSGAWFLTQSHLFLVAIYITVGSAAVLVFYELYSLICPKLRESSSSWPPTPPEVPILGHLHLLKANPHLDMHALSLKYGPIVHLRLGSTHALVISSSSMAKLVLKNHDKSFASRSSSGAAVEILSHGFQDLACAPYGPHWRHMRKLCLLELFSMKRIESFANVRNVEVSSLVSSIREESAAGKPIVMSIKLGHLMLNIISVMSMGMRMINHSDSQHNGDDEEEELKNFLDAVKELFRLGGVVNNLGDYFPRLRWLDLQGYERRLRNVTKVFDDFVLKQVDHKRKLGSSCDSNARKDLLDILLSLPNETNGKLSMHTVTSTMLNILSAGTDTSSTTVEWTLAELIRNPAVMAKVQSEIDTYVGKARRVEEADFPNLPYLEAVVKESLRLHPPAPLLIPHESIEPCELLSYNIPAKTRLYVNVWAIGRDQAEWEDPLEFCPERFIGKDIDLKGQDFRILPFGSGRRMCPGISLGLAVVQLTLARLLHSFDFSLPSWQNPEELDMSETFGLTMSKTEPLQLMASPRLSKELYD